MTRPVKNFLYIFFPAKYETGCFITLFNIEDLRYKIIVTQFSSETIGYKHDKNERSQMILLSYKKQYNNQHFLMARGN